METHLTASLEAGKHFYQHFHAKGSVVMLNLLRFKAIADYLASPELAPATPISGRAAYQLYIDATLPLLAKAGSKLLFQGESNHFLIGPGHESWDMVLLVEHESVTRFMAFAEQDDYKLILGHRTAALADSRLLPITELPV